MYFYEEQNHYYVILYLLWMAFWLCFFLVAPWLKTSTLDQHAMDQRKRKITIQGIFTSFFMLQRYTYVVDLQVLLRFNSLLCVSLAVFIHVSLPVCGFQVAAWMCWLIWIALVISGIIRAVRNRRLRTGKADKANFAEADPTA